MTPGDALAGLHPAVRAWFEEAFGLPTPAQAQAWPVIAQRKSALILAPTGSGKTLAAFLQCLSHLYGPGETLAPGVRVLYVSPLKALNNDIHRNLHAPLAGIAAAAARLGIPLPAVEVAVRTGDTPPQERRAMARRPPHVLITTPESLYLLLTTAAAPRLLGTTQYVIVDEIHALAGNKRGVHLSLSLERLEELCCKVQGKTPGGGLVRIGLSATQRPLERLARYLGGQDPRTGRPRPVEVVDAGSRRKLGVVVECPVPDLRAPPGGSVWPSLVGRVLELIRFHRSTIVFVNNRGLAERLTARLNEAAGEEVARTHHGSLSKETRAEVEGLLQSGRLRALVATSSLELGIDVGAVDLVVQVGSPKAVTRGLQRVGRAGHLLGATSAGRILPLHPLDLLEAAVIARRMLAGEIESTRVPRNCLDVLAQQVTAMTAPAEWRSCDLLRVVRGSYCYRDLPVGQWEAVLELLSGRRGQGPGAMRPRVHWDRARDRVRAREGGRLLALQGAGTIPDRGHYPVYLSGGGVRLGELDEEFVYESRPGDAFALGSATWRIERIEADRVVVQPAPGMLPRLPFWKGDGLGRPRELGRALGQALREMEARLAAGDLEAWLGRTFPLDGAAARTLAAFLCDQQGAAGAFPHDRRIVAETFTDELGNVRIALLSCFGGRVHAAWFLALARRLRESLGVEVEGLWADDGLLFRMPAGHEWEGSELALAVGPGELRALVLDELGSSPLFAARFRENAARALVLPRSQRRRLPLWLQRLRAQDLLEAVRGDPGHPLVVETARECLEDVLDLAGAEELARGLHGGEIAVHTARTRVPSPFAVGLQLDFTAAYLYQGDEPRAERQGRLLALHREAVAELLGQGAMAAALDPRALAQVEAGLCYGPLGRVPASPAEAEEWLLWAGDVLPPPEPAARQALEALAAEGRSLQVGFPLPGGGRSALWIAAEARDRYRAAGAELPGEPAAGAGPESPLPEAVKEVLRRFAGTRGPFTAAEVTARYGWEARLVEEALAGLVAGGELAAGPLHPGRPGTHYCDVRVLRRAHHLTLQVLRREVEPCSGEDFCRFLLAWQGVLPRRPGRPLEEILAQLAGVVLPVEVWERDVLRCRAGELDPLALDRLCAAGAVAWVGAGAGRVAFSPREELALVRPAPGERPTGLAGRVLRCLEERGASFLGELAAAVGTSPGEAQEALHTLAWSGWASCDLFEPARRGGRPGSPPDPVRGALEPAGAWRRPALGGRALRRAAVRAAAAQVSGGGRWFALRPPEGDPDQAAEAVAAVLLERYGVVARALALADGYGALWPRVSGQLARWEATGKVRRGYFVRGLGGAQFALGEAVEALREARGALGTEREAEPLLLSACDPALAYALGAGGEGELPAVARQPANHLVVAAGRPVLASEGYGRRLWPGAGRSEATLLAALGALAGLLLLPPALRPRRRLVVERWAGLPAAASPGRSLLERAGFAAAGEAMVLWPSAAEACWAARQGNRPGA